MADPKTIKNIYERNLKAIKLKPSTGISTGKSTIRIENGTTCKIESSGWKLISDIGIESGGNNAGPGPGVLERAALGSCLAMSYAQQAAVMEIPVNKIEIEVKTDFDARGMFGIDNRPPGFSKINYTVHIQSPASENEIQKMIDQADKHSPVRDDFTRPIPIERKVEIQNTNKNEA